MKTRLRKTECMVELLYLAKKKYMEFMPKYSGYPLPAISTSEINSEVSLKEVQNKSVNFRLLTCHRQTPH